MWMRSGYKGLTGALVVLAPLVSALAPYGLWCLPLLATLFVFYHAQTMPTIFTSVALDGARPVFGPWPRWTVFGLCLAADTAVVIALHVMGRGLAATLALEPLPAGVIPVWIGLAFMAVLRLEPFDEIEALAGGLRGPEAREPCEEGAPDVPAPFDPADLARQSEAALMQLVRLSVRHGDEEAELSAALESYLDHGDGWARLQLLVALLENRRELTGLATVFVTYATSFDIYARDGVGVLPGTLRAAFRVAAGQARLSEICAKRGVAVLELSDRLAVAFPSEAELRQAAHVLRDSRAETALLLLADRVSQALAAPLAPAFERAAEAVEVPEAVEARVYAAIQAAALDDCDTRRRA